MPLLRFLIFCALQNGPINSFPDINDSHLVFWQGGNIGKYLQFILFDSSGPTFSRTLRHDDNNANLNNISLHRDGIKFNTKQYIAYYIEEMMKSFTSIFGLIYDIIENPKSIRILHSFSSHFLKRIALKYALILKANQPPLTYIDRS